MKKSILNNVGRFFLLLFTFFLFLISSKSVSALWNKYPSNPIFSGTPGGWDSRDTSCPYIIFNGNTYKMWYSGNNGSGWRIGYATSLNGLMWYKVNYPVIDIFSPNNWEKDTGHSFVLYEENLYKMWYSSISYSWISGEDRYRLRYATSFDGINWDEKDWVLTGSKDKWDAGGINRGHSILKINGIYHLWYTGTDAGTNWRIGYATSLDGISWTKQNNCNPVITKTETWEYNNVSYPHVIYNNGVYEMWYATGAGDLPTRIVYAYSLDGIHWIKPADKNPVLEVGPYGSWDSVNISSPFVLKEGNKYKMWYDGYDGKQWRIGYAESIDEINPTPTLKPTPTPTFTPTPTPTPTPLPPLIFLPGLGGSWNFESLVLGIEKPYKEWVITPGPGEKVYYGFLKTLKNAGYNDNGPQKNLFIFTYNWTKKVSQIAEDLKEFIQNTVKPKPGQKIILVGHSLGGLTARTYVQNNPQNQVTTLLTLGSPHKGAVQVYYAWAGGDLRFMNILERIAVGLLLQIRRSGFNTDKETVQNIAPVLKDLLPTFNYLKQNNQEIPYLQMIEKNDWLDNLNNNPPSNLFSGFTTLLSNIENSTPRWLLVEPRNWLDKILNLWSDGKPVGDPILDTGDRTVLSLSAQLSGAQLVELQGLGHREIVQTQTGQEKIMEILNLKPTPYSVSEDISEPILVFLIASPATLEIFDTKGNSVGEGDGKLMFVFNPQEGNYQIKITGTGNGPYQLYVGQLTKNGDIWSEISGKINQGEIQIREVNFQPNSPLPYPFVDNTGEISLQSTIQKILETKEFINNNLLSPKIKKKLISSLNEILELISQKNYHQAITTSYELHLYLGRLSKQKIVPSSIVIFLKNKIIEIINDLEKVYIKNQSSPYSDKKLKTEIKIAENLSLQMEKKLKKFSQATSEDGALYLLAKEKLNIAKNSSSHQAHINALGVKYLSLEGIILFNSGNN
ncbi:MAG: alpha/beta fold hydrolase [Microgenomates group bacterium]